MTGEDITLTSNMLAQHASQRAAAVMSGASQPLVAYVTSRAPRPDAIYQSDTNRVLASVTPSVNGELCYKKPEYFSVDESLPTVEKRRRQTIAKAICLRCPVIDSCLDDALLHGQVGIRGGTTERQRNIIKKNAEQQLQIS